MLSQGGRDNSRGDSPFCYINATARCCNIVYMSKKNKSALWLFAAALIVVCCGGKVYGVMPFGTAMFCALSNHFFIGFIAPVYLLCCFLFTFEVWRLYTCGAVIFLMAVRWFLGLKIPRFDKYVAKTLFSIGALVIETVLFGLFMPIVDAVITGFIAVVFYYFASHAAACVEKSFACRLSVIDGASMCVTLIVLGIACGRAQVYGFIVGLAPAMFVLLMLGAVGVKETSLGGAAIAFGLGLNGNIALIPSLIACVFAIAAFGKLARPIYLVAALGLFAATATLFFVEAVAVGKSTLMLASGGVLYCLLPKRAVRAVKAYFDFDGTARLAVRHYINRTKADAGNRMLAVATVFDETARLMNAFASSSPDYAAIGAALSDSVCPYCPNRASCDSEVSSAAFTALAERAHAGKAIISDFPEFFTSSCARTVDVIAHANEITDSAREMAKERECENKAKTIVTERLVAIKDVLEELGRSQALPVGFDGTAEERIVNELGLVGVECAEAFCSQGGVTAIVRTQSASGEKIRRAVSACLKREYELKSLERTQAAGWSVASLKKRPAYEAVYARAGLGKNGVTGDSYTFERIGDKFLAALLDGMGAGMRAGESSGAATELISCFYRAGFDSQSVIAGVNRFLKLPATENYSAADVVVCDLDTAAVDIIKIGSPPCFIKTTDTVLKIESNSLPIGVLDEMRPFVTTKRLYPGQMLIMVTDGVSDCFSGDELPEYINGLSVFNPEKAVNAILTRALALSGGAPRDDMTAIAFRLFDAPKRKKKSAV